MKINCTLNNGKPCFCCEAFMAGLAYSAHNDALKIRELENKLEEITSNRDKIKLDQ